jgi:hypothetical protein
MRALLPLIATCLFAPLALPAGADGNLPVQIAQDASADGVATPTKDATKDSVAPISGEPAPFGLTWGMTKEQIEGLGVSLTSQEDQSRGAEFVATKLPKMVEGANGVVIALGFGGKLYRVTVISNEYDNDGYGAQIGTRYDELVAVLTQKYGKGKAHDFTSSDYRGDRWAYGLWKNENSKYTTFETETLDIEISCRSQDMSDPYWVIIYDYKPGSELEEAAKKQHEKETL